MKIVVWGGPWDGRVIEVDRPRPLRCPLGQPLGLAYHLATAETMTEVREIIYEPRQLCLEDRRTWWVMVPSDVSEEVLQHLAARRGHPPVDTQGRGLHYIEEAL